MSIYATWLSIDDEGHPFTCNRWRRARGGEQPEGYGNHGDRWVRSKRPCNCTEKAPLIYRGSHVNPDARDPRGGYLFACAIPNHCHPSVRGQATDDGPPVNYLRLSMGEDHTTYHGMEKGHATLVLDLRQVTELRDTLTQWLEAEERA